MKGVEDESKLMMEAVGSKAFDIDVDHDVLDDALNHAFRFKSVAKRFLAL